MKLPTGKRIERCFLADTRLHEVYEWAECAGELSGLVPGGGERVDLPEFFELLMSFPTKVLDDRSKTLQELGLVPNAALVIREVDKEAASTSS